MKSICIYGKGGIGKSTVSANVACALASMGRRVLLVGCDPKADSTRTVCGHKIPTVLDVVLNNPRAKIENYIVRGFQGVDCVETGGPKPGDGCAGRGVVTALRALREQEVLSPSRYDVVIFDILGDVVCGGFSLPLKDGFADTVLIVTTCDFMAMYAANNICVCIEKFATRNNVKLGGFIYNERSVVQNSTIPRAFAEKLNSEIIGTIPANSLIMEAEMNAMTVLQYAPESLPSKCFHEMASHIDKGYVGSVPAPMDEDALESFFASFRETMTKI